MGCPSLPPLSRRLQQVFGCHLSPDTVSGSPVLYGDPLGTVSSATRPIYHLPQPPRAHLSLSHSFPPGLLSHSSCSDSAPSLSMREETFLSWRFSTSKCLCQTRPHPSLLTSHRSVLFGQQQPHRHLRSLGRWDSAVLPRQRVWFALIRRKGWRIQGPACREGTAFILRPLGFTVLK